MVETKEAIGPYLTAINVGAREGRLLPRWRIDGRHGQLGYIEWYGRWFAYTYVPLAGTRYNSDCASDLASFLQEKTEWGRKVIRAHTPKVATEWI